MKSKTRRPLPKPTDLPPKKDVRRNDCPEILIAAALLICADNTERVVRALIEYGDGEGIALIDRCIDRMQQVPGMLVAGARVERRFYRVTTREQIDVPPKLQSLAQTLKERVIE
jgi:hypothetical protein